MQIVSREKAASLLFRTHTMVKPLRGAEPDFVFTGWTFSIDGNEYECRDPLLFEWTPHERSTWPFRYMTSLRPVEAHSGHSRAGEAFPAGTRFKINMVSRFKDVGITDKLDSETGYIFRVSLDKLKLMFKDFSMEA
jgi:hypothetical protein